MQLSWSMRLLPLVAPLLVSSFAKAQSMDPPVTGKGLVGGALLGSEVVLLTEAAIKVKPAWAYYVGAGVGAIGGGIGGHFLESSLSSREAMYMLSAGMLLLIPTTVAAMNAVSYDTPLEYTQDSAPVDQPVDDLPLGTANPGNDMPTMPAMTPESPAAPAAVPPPATTPPPAAVPPPATMSPAPAATPAPAAPTTTTPPPAKPQTERSRSANHAVAHWRAAPTFAPPALIRYSGSGLGLSVPAIEIRDTYTRREVAMYGVKQQSELRVPLLQMEF